MQNPSFIPVSDSLADYLEAILALQHDGKGARVRDIAERVGVKYPAVSNALKHLAEKRLVNYDPYRRVTLTARGRRMAREVARRHDLLRRFFREVLQVSPKVAEANACRAEHVLEPRLLRRLARFTEFLAGNRKCRQAWQHFAGIARSGGSGREGT